MTPESWSAIVGLFMPYVVEVVKTFLPQKRWVSFTLALVTSAVVGGVTSFLGEQFDKENILSSTGSALIASQAVYNYWFKPKKQDVKVAKVLGR
jgi:ABC-type uncharacterized transport system permease subunit